MKQGQWVTFQEFFAATLEKPAPAPPLPIILSKRWKERIKTLRSALAAVLVFMLAGCRTPDAALLSMIDREVATVCSEAKLGGPRSKGQIAAVESQHAALVGHITDYGK